MTSNEGLAFHLHSTTTQKSLSKATLLGFVLIALLASPRPSASQSVAAGVGDQGSASSAQPSTASPQVTLRLTETVSSATARVGQRISLEVVNPVEVGGKVVVAAGASAHATVSVARRRGHNHRDGKLLLTIQSVSRVDGTETQLHSTSLDKGSGKGAPIFGPCTFPFPGRPCRAV